MKRFNRNATRYVASWGSSIIALAVALTAANAGAQDSQAATKPAAGDDTVVVVTGYRASLQKSLNVKKKSDVILDTINAEDIGKFPESNLAEALVRLPGISIERDNGEGRTVTVRGLGGDFVRTRLNGIETTATTGVNEAQGQVSRSRGFDYNVFATDLFTSLSVMKSAQASVDEGSLGATIDIDTGHPLDFKKRKMALSIQDAHYADFDKNHRDSPRITALYSDVFFGGKLGFSLSGSYSKVTKDISDYNRNPGAFEFNYRGSPLLGPVQNGTGGTATPTCLTTAGGAPVVNATTNSSPLNCYWGFALPTSLRTSGATSLGIDSNSLMFGSDPTAYALITPTTIIPALVSLEQLNQKQKRVGLTSSLQWKPTENTKVTVDALYAQFTYDNQSYILGTFGLNRHFDTARAEIGLTNATTGLRPYNTATPTVYNYWADRRAAYGNVCNPAAATATAAAVDCTGTGGSATTPVFSTAQYWNGTAYVTVPSVLATNTTNGNTWSTNPYNLDTYDYYNNPGSVGYNAASAAADHRGILMYDQLVGHEHTAIMDAHVNSAGRADYLKLNRMDWQTDDASSKNDTIFTQYDFTIDQRFNENLKLKFVYGSSYSHLRIDGGRVDLYGLDKNGFVYDDRGGGKMPVYQTGFDASDVNQFDLVKGYASISRYVQTADNTYQNARLDFNYWVNDHLNFDFGISKREYGYSNTYSTFTRSVLPTLQELHKYGQDKGDATYANLTLAQLGHISHFGAGLDVPAGTTTAWWSPDRDKFDAILHFNCNCVNQFGDFRVNPTLGSGLFVNESDTGSYGQANFNLDLLGRTLRGNTGVRVVTTTIDSRSYGTTGIFNAVALQGSNQYTDTLPSLNLDYELTDAFMIRFAAAKTMSRPSLNLLGPGVTSLSISATPSSSAIPSISLGNPSLKPYRSTNYDLNFEWYFNKDSLLSVAFYQKNLSSFPRVESKLGKLSDFIPADLHTQIRSSLTPTQQAYLDSDDEFNVTTAVDSPGGVINGIEVQYQQPLTFLPKPFDGFGIQANVTHIQSKLSYLSQAGVRSTAPWPFASPHTINMTLYYEKGPWQARVSGSWRERFANTFPQATGTCSPGLTTSNGGVCTAIYNDFGGTESQTFWDFKGSYKVNKHVNIDLAVQNILGQDQSSWVYTNPSAVQDYRSNGGAIITTAIRFVY